MKTELWCIGKSKFKFIEQGVEEYLKRISRFSSLRLIEIPKGKINRSASPQQVKSYESELLQKRLQASDYLVLLDEKGRALNSKEFAEFIESHQLRSTPRLIFIIGGAYGFDEQMYRRADFKLSLSAMTFSHQLIKVIFLEQFYRAMTILHRHPYHNE